MRLHRMALCVSDIKTCVYRVATYRQGGGWGGNLCFLCNYVVQKKSDCIEYPHRISTSNRISVILAMIYLLALSPIILLFVLSLTKGVKTAVWITAIYTIALFFFWGAGLPHLVASLGTSAVTTLNILMIVFGATFLYNIMSDAGLIRDMTQSLQGLEASDNTRFFLVSFGMTAFFEGVAGFGTPGAIVPLILIAMGYNALRSVATVLLFDGLFSAFGAVGIPIMTGIQQTLQLSTGAIQKIGLWSSLMLSVAGLAAVLSIIMQDRNSELNGQQKRDTVTIFYLYLFFCIPYIGFAWFAPELATVMASLTMLGLSVWYLRKPNTTIQLSPWIPYALLSLLLLLPKIWPFLHNLLAVDVGLWNILDTGINGFFRPMLSPLLPFVLIGLCVAYFKRNKKLNIRSSLKKVGDVSIILYPSIVIAQLMILSGVSQPSMIEYIAILKVQLGLAYPLVSPFVGIMGTFITGSTTLSNIVFAPSQFSAAQMLSLDPEIVLSLQHTGASIGNAICLFNIIAAATIAGIHDYGSILKSNLKPTLWLGLLLGLLGLGLIYLG